MERTTGRKITHGIKVIIVRMFVGPSLDVTAQLPASRCSGDTRVSVPGTRDQGDDEGEGRIRSGEWTT